MRRLRWLVAIAALGAAVYFFPRPFLYRLGAYLVKADGPVKSDCMFVLAGDFNGQRIMKAAELYRLGMAPKLFISGPYGIYGRSEDELAIAFAKANRTEDVPFIPLPNHGRSTVTEGLEVLPRLRQEGCRSVLVVTSDFHTRRAGRILRRIWPDLQVRIASAPTVDYDAERWWTNRNYQKTFFFEWTKTAADWIGL
ncbi:MAG: YdcF family protein [Acidobacteria bacterium]|nr:YdcF family protein [Acidobacteriota bacterium]